MSVAPRAAAAAQGGAQGRLRRWGGGGQEAAADSLQLNADAQGDAGQCGTVDQDTEYVLWGPQWGMPLDHIPSPEMCCAMCQGVPKCAAWTWVKDAGLDGCPSQCWLKDRKPDAKNKKGGFVSGLPPTRPPIVIPPTRSGKFAALEGAAREAEEEEEEAQKHETGSRRVKLLYDTEAVEVRDPGSIFCFSLMMPRSYELELLKNQHKLGAGIFACDEAAVYSNESITVAHGVRTRVVDSDLVCKLGGESYTALNSWIFVAVWRKVVEDATYMHFSWTVKVDPDSVFLPDRLNMVLRDHKAAGYLNNCKYGLHGPIEVLSRSAVAALAADYDASPDGKSPKKCVEQLDLNSFGEDVFLDRCLKDVLKVSREMDERLMCEAHCDCPDWFWCKNGTSRVSFHPFKRPDLYSQCMANALDSGSTMFMQKK